MNIDWDHIKHYGKDKSKSQIQLQKKEEQPIGTLKTKKRKVIQLQDVSLSVQNVLMSILRWLRDFISKEPKMAEKGREFVSLRHWLLQGLTEEKENLQNEQITSNLKSPLKVKRRRSHSEESDIEGNSNESSNALEKLKRRRVSDMEEK
ncbi:MAG: hypothetical protein EZS28_020835 [Streblomastix strix]|uniref:Uncharacterized protein n=1 Tax=Streblomastix strix TaxID=222440 RepID=A0A5J4VMB8_9EUKA|nr:MAG: hypothetical protein EZS28_020835 [Streblomastix strix]